MTWSPSDSAALYELPSWSSGYFRIGEAGTLVVRPDPEQPDREVDLYALTGEILRRGVRAPLLLRFDGILRHRVRRITAAFDAARADADYGAPYRCIYPIKVNQQRHVVEQLVDGGREHGLGLEVGSKPELLAVMGLGLERDTVVVCNGYKDAEYLETALLARQMGLEAIVVIEKFSELGTLLAAAEDLDIEPAIGVRMKPRIKGSGRWKDSGGDRSKFGLTTRQIVRAVKLLEETGQLDCLRLLHFHIGSQVTDVRSIKAALREAAQTLIGLVNLGAPIAYLDVGGGLAVDYDGSRTTADSSRNYSLQEYANDVVWQVKEACAEAGITEPILLSESGRSLTAHHAVLVTEVLGVSNYTETGQAPTPGPDEPPPVAALAELLANLEQIDGEDVSGYREAYHDAVQLRDEAMLLFNMGQLDLEGRARVEEYFWSLCRRIVDLTGGRDFVPEELSGLAQDMADTYFLNFSLFQSLPDSWAIQQLFPVLPIHRHTERPARQATLVDVTCDSDGKIDRFISREDEKHTLEVHELRDGERYFLAFFLVGAYQEILGDMHNLFGDTNAIHVDIGPAGKAVLPHVVRGDRVQELLSYVEFHENELVARLRRQVEEALEEERLTYEQSALLLERYERGLASYSYLERGAGQT